MIKDFLDGCRQFITYIELPIIGIILLVSIISFIWFFIGALIEEGRMRKKMYDKRALRFLPYACQSNADKKKFLVEVKKLESKIDSVPYLREDLYEGSFDLVSPYETYSAIDWNEDVKFEDIRYRRPKENQQMLRNACKQFCAYELISDYCEFIYNTVHFWDCESEGIGIEGIKAEDQPELVKDCDYILKVSILVENLFAELYPFKRENPLSYDALWSVHRKYKNLRYLAWIKGFCPMCEYSQQDYEDFLYNPYPDIPYSDAEDHEFTSEDYCGRNEGYLWTAMIDIDGPYYDFWHPDNDDEDNKFSKDTYFEEKRKCNIHYYCLGVVKSCKVDGNINYRSVIDKLQHDLGVSLEERQLKDDSERSVAKRLESIVASKICDTSISTIDYNNLLTLLDLGDNSKAPLLIEIAVTTWAPALGTTCIGYVASGELSVGDKVKLNYNLKEKENESDSADNGVLTAKVTWIETNGKNLIKKAKANQVLSFGLGIEYKHLLEQVDGCSSVCLCHEITSVEHCKA